MPMMKYATANMARAWYNPAWPTTNPVEDTGETSVPVSWAGATPRRGSLGTATTQSSAHPGLLCLPAHGSPQTSHPLPCQGGDVPTPGCCHLPPRASPAHALHLGASPSPCHARIRPRCTPKNQTGQGPCCPPSPGALWGGGGSQDPRALQPPSAGRAALHPSSGTGS